LEKIWISNPLRFCPQGLICHFEQLSFLERLSPSSISKVMVVWRFFVINFWNPRSMINLYNVRILPSNIH